MKFCGKCQAWRRAEAENSARESRGMEPWELGRVRLRAQELYNEWHVGHLDPPEVQTLRAAIDTMPMGLTHLDYSEQERER